MKAQNVVLTNASALRQIAEDNLKNVNEKTNLHLSEGDQLKLIHELQVHQIELQLQNDELVKANIKANIEEQKYIELYDFAPTGYVTVTQNGKILNINFAAAKMFDKERIDIINKQLQLFLPVKSRSHFSLFIKKIFEEKNNQILEVAILKEDSSTLHLYIEGTVSTNGDHCLLNFIDISLRKIAEENLNETIFKLAYQKQENEKKAKELQILNQKLNNNIQELKHLSFNLQTIGEKGDSQISKDCK